VRSPAVTLLEGGLSVLQDARADDRPFPVRRCRADGLEAGLEIAPARECEGRRLEGRQWRRFGLIGAAVAAVAGWGLLWAAAVHRVAVATGLPLMLAVPLVVLTSRATIGQLLLASRVLLTPVRAMRSGRAEVSCRADRHLPKERVDLRVVGVGSPKASNRPCSAIILADRMSPPRPRTPARRRR